MAGKRAHAALQQCTPAVLPAACFPQRIFPTRSRTRIKLFDQGEIDKASKGVAAGAQARYRSGAGARASSQQQLNNNKGNNTEWRSLGISISELSLPLTLLTGQSFRWRPTGPSQYTGVVGSHLISLREREDDVDFLLHTADRNGAAEAELRDYLTLDTSLEKLYAEFAVADVRFADLAPYLVGARLLRQNPLECLYEFICSSNNHIQRISGMVEYLAAYGPRLGRVQGLDFHTFPSLEELADVTEEQLRKAGFGYRAKFIVGATEALRSKAGGGEQWLMSLRSLSLEEAVKALCSLPGVGPKVAACIALFSLDQHHAIPVDTHVWQIAVRNFVPELAGKSLTLRLHKVVQEAFIKRFGKYAGWALQVFFIAELSSHQELLPEHLRLSRQNTVKVKRKVVQPLLVEKDERMAVELLSSEKTTISTQLSSRKQKHISGKKRSTGSRSLL
ncbi:unnamed protein product [Calypogeia fissa]